MKCAILTGSIFVFIGAIFSAKAADLLVDADFPGGSGVVDSINQEKRVIKLNPTPHKDRGWACWWWVKISGITPGETFSLNIGDAPWATPNQAALSSDGGKTWTQSTPGKRDGKRIVYEISSEKDKIQIAWGPPFVPENAKALIDKASAEHGFATAFNLCKTRDGHSTPALKVEDENLPKDLFGIWIQARQHAWESGSSWVAKGLVDWLVSDDELAKELRQKALIHVVPIMDIDNVLRGAGGKNQKPQDHNRDWTDKPHWRAVFAAQQAIKKQNEAGLFDLFIDLHNPGADSRYPYFYVPPKDLLSKTGQRNLASFLKATREQMIGPLKFAGRTIESGKSYDPRAWSAISKNWVANHTADHVVAATLETAWNTPDSTTAGYEQVGRELGKAMTLYFRDQVRLPEKEK